MAATVAKTFHVSPSFLAAKSLCKLWVMTAKNDTCDLKIGMFFGNNGFWANLLRKWDDEKTEKLKELASSETSCRKVDDEDNGQVRKAARPSMSRQTSHDMESIMEEEEDEHEELIKRTREVLQRHRGEAPVQRSGKRGRSPISTTQKIKTERQSILEACKGEICKELSKVEVRELRYSQLSCKETFQCGRSVSQLVQDLLDRKVSLFAPFLRLTVFETTDEETNDPEMYRQSSTKKWKRPRDVERQRLQPEHTHAGPALHTEL